MKITVVGGGNIATQFAVHCANKSNDVTILTSKPECFSKNLSIIRKDGSLFLSGEIKNATDNPSEAINNAELIFICVPSFCMESYAEKITPFLKKGAIIMLVPGTGGGECAFKKALDGGCTIAGIQRVPSVARLKEYGKCVCATGYRDELFVSAIPHKNTDECCEIIQNIFDIKCSPLPNYLSLTLTPSNPILHTTRLYNIFGDYHDGKSYDSLPLFYEDWDNKSSELLFRCDEEVQNICNKIPCFDLSYVKSLKIHYESPTIDAMTKKISSIDGFKGLKTPSIHTEGGYVPDLNSRYFVADFSYGLAIIKQIADLCGVETENINTVLDWYKKIRIDKKMFNYHDYGIDSYEKFIDFYSM